LPTRRDASSWDLLFEQDGRTLSDLLSHTQMTRFGVMKHVDVLEEAGLVVTRKVGRSRLHYLNPVPIRRIHDRWIDKYTAPHASALVPRSRPTGGTNTMSDNLSCQIYRVFIRATPEEIWEAITTPSFTTRYFHGAAIEVRGKPCDVAWPRREHLG